MARLYYLLIEDDNSLIISAPAENPLLINIYDVTVEEAIIETTLLGYDKSVIDKIDEVKSLANESIVKNRTQEILINEKVTQNTKEHEEFYKINYDENRLPITEENIAYAQKVNMSVNIYSTKSIDFIKSLLSPTYAKEEITGYGRPRQIGDMMILPVFVTEASTGNNKLALLKGVSNDINSVVIASIIDVEAGYNNHSLGMYFNDVNDNNLLLKFTDTSTGNKVKLFKSDDLGDTWTLVSLPLEMDEYYIGNRINYNCVNGEWIITVYLNVDERLLYRTTDFINSDYTIIEESFSKILKRGSHYYLYNRAGKITKTEDFISFVEINCPVEYNTHGVVRIANVLKVENKTLLDASDVIYSMDDSQDIEVDEWTILPINNYKIEAFDGYFYHLRKRTGDRKMYYTSDFVTIKNHELDGSIENLSRNLSYYFYLISKLDEKVALAGVGVTNIHPNVLISEFKYIGTHEETIDMPLEHIISNGTTVSLVDIIRHIAKEEISKTIIN